MYVTSFAVNTIFIEICLLNHQMLLRIHNFMNKACIGEATSFGILVPLCLHSMVVDEYIYMYIHSTCIHVHVYILYISVGMDLAVRVPSTRWACVYWGVAYHVFLHVYTLTHATKLFG